MKNETLFSILFVIIVFLCWYLYIQSINQYKVTNKQIDEYFQLQRKSKKQLQSQNQVNKNTNTKESFDSMAGMRPQLYEKGTASIELNEVQQKRYKELEETCKHRREKCYIAGNLTSCNYQYDICIQDALWDSKINTPKDYVPPKPVE